jgi:uncharacterized protein YwqG
MSIISKIFNLFKNVKVEEEGLDAHIDFLKSLRQPAIALKKSSTDSNSQIGGRPNLPDDIEWPSWKNSHLAFLCQLDLSQIPDEFADKLPKYGGLLFFYCQEQETWGFAPKDKGSWKVIYTDKDLSLIPEREFPADIKEHSIYESKEVSFKAVNVYPDYQNARVNELDLNDTQMDEYDELSLSVFDSNYAHQMFGYPSPVQGNNMELECQLVSNGLDCGSQSGYNDPRSKEFAIGKDDWVLLLQLDSDDDCGMMWGDAGMLYFWIRKQDLENANFDNVWMILQCH